MKTSVTLLEFMNSYYILRVLLLVVVVVLCAILWL